MQEFLYKIDYSFLARHILGPPLLPALHYKSNEKKVYKSNAFFHYNDSLKAFAILSLFFIFEPKKIKPFMTFTSLTLKLATSPTSRTS